MWTQGNSHRHLLRESVPAVQDFVRRHATLELSL